MSLTAAFTVAIDSDRSDITVTDSTVYGAPNLVRADTSVYFSAAKVSYAGVETDVDVTGDDADPQTDTAWTFSYDEGDGYWKMRWVVVPEYSALTTYAQYDAVVSGGVVYRSKSAGNVGNAVTNTTYFEVISDPTDLADNKDTATESTNCETYVYERIFTSNAQYGYGNCVSQNSMHTESDDEDVMWDYDLFSIMLNAAITADERTQVLSGELICRKISSRFSNYIDE
jgi:hypothetical protein